MTSAALIAIIAAACLGTGATVLIVADRDEERESNSESRPSQAAVEGIASGILTTTPTPEPTPTPTSITTSTSTPQPTPAPTPTATAPPATTPAPATTAQSTASLEFVNLPTAVDEGEKFTVTWRITGPAGTTGQDASLEVSQEYHSNEAGSSVNSSSNSSQSYGSFTIPKEFSSTYSFSGLGSVINLEATATVNGQHLTKTAQITLQ